MSLFKKITLSIGATACLTFSFSAFAVSNQDNALQTLTNQYLSNHAISENITAVTLGVSANGAPLQTYYAGKTFSDPYAPTPNDTNLSQIGSITKSFISVLILQLEAQGKLNINDPISKYLVKTDGSPLYPQWKDVTIKELLNMTSGIPDYLANPALGKIYANNYTPGPSWTSTQLIDFAVQLQAECITNCVADGIFPPGSNWFYSNTNYILAEMIISAVTGKSVEHWLNKQVFASNQLNLSNTFYLPYSYSNLPSRYNRDNIPARMLHGYFNEPDMDLPIPAGTDLTNLNSSLFGAAGDMTSNMQDITTWITALFQNNEKLKLGKTQILELMTTVCDTNPKNTGCKPGEPATVGPTVAQAFSLGLGEAYLPNLGNVWAYHGEPLGYRFVWILVQNPKLPVSTLLVTSMLNSASTNDDLACLAINAAETLEELPLTNCSAGSFRF